MECPPSFPSLAESDATHLRERLGFDPYDVLDVASRDAAGHPAVVRIHPVRGFPGDQAAPCPTLFWLVDPAWKTRIGRLESTGAIGRFEARLAADAPARTRHEEDHQRYAAARLDSLVPEARSLAESQTWLPALSTLGIGGIRNRDALKCLHLHYAWHRIAPTLIGEWIEEALADATRPT